MKLYHATHHGNAVAIMQEGLLGGHGFDPVHLAEDADGTFDFVMMLYQLNSDQVTLLEVDVTGLTLDSGWDGEGTWAYDGVIPPHRLRVMENPT